MSELLAQPVFETQHMLLRAIEPQEWHTPAAQEGDYAMLRAGAGWVPGAWSAQRVRTWTAEPERSILKEDVLTWAIATKADDQVVDTINSHHINRRVRFFSYGIEVSPTPRRAGVATAAIGLLLGFFFTELRCQKCNVGVYSYNEASLALHRGLGFIEEGRQRRCVYTAGAFYDEVLFGLTAEEFAGDFPR